MFRFIFIILLIALSFCSFYLNSQAANRTNIGTEIGRQAPPIELGDLGGNTVTLESLKGSVVLLTFWSMHSSPCLAKMPSLNRLHDAFKDKKFEIVSIAIGATEESVREYVLKNNIGFRVLLDKNRDGFFSSYDTPGVPATYLIDRNGVIVEKFTGLAVWDAPEMKDRVIMLLKMRQGGS